MSAEEEKAATNFITRLKRGRREGGKAKKRALPCPTHQQMGVYRAPPPLNRRKGVRKSRKGKRGTVKNIYV